MKLIRLGDYIEPIDVRNDKNYKENDVRGISTKKEFISTKADLNGVSLNSYKIVSIKHFAYVSDTSRRGDKISLAFNDSMKEYIVSSISTVFKVKNETVLNPYYLFMYFKRAEFDRYARFNSWGSARETFSWEDFCNIKISLPSIEVQNKYVGIYKTLNNNLNVYQSKLDDLKFVCDGYLDKIKKEYSSKKIDDYILQSNKKNEELTVLEVCGIENTHQFISTKANMNGVDLKGYKIVSNKDFVYNPSRINIGSIALRNGKDCIVSPMYEVFKVEENTKLLPEYLMLWFLRDEFKHYTSFYSFGSVRDTFDFNLMKNINIPLPPIKLQKSIIGIYKEFINRKRICTLLEKKIEKMCPILIAGAIKESEAGE